MLADALQGFPATKTAGTLLCPAVRTDLGMEHDYSAEDVPVTIKRYKDDDFVGGLAKTTQPKRAMLNQTISAVRTPAASKAGIFPHTLSRDQR
jgi:hypothetical protein